MVTGTHNPDLVLIHHLSTSLEIFKHATDPRHMPELMLQSNHQYEKGHHLVASGILEYFGRVP